MADLDSAFADVGQEVSEGERATRLYEQRRQADDRSKIAKAIVYVFVWAVVGVLVIVVGASFFLGWAKVKDSSEYAMAILSSVLLPVVTLVIGYYFGKDK